MPDEIRVWIVERKRNKKIAHDLRWWDTATGRFRSKCAGTDRKRAEHERLRLEAELSDGTHRDVRRVSWPDFVAEHIANMARRPATVEDTKRTLDEFGEVCKPRSPMHVSYRMIESYHQHLRGKGNSVATRNKRLRYIRAAMNAAVRRDYLKTNPMDKWQWEREDRKIPRALTEDEKTKLLKASPTEQWRTFVHVALTTGCRCGELLGLTWDRVSLDDASVIVTGTKAHQDRVQPLDSVGVGMLRALQASTLKDGGPFRTIKPTNAAKQFRGIVRQADIAHCTIHDLRRTFCTDLARLGVNQLVVQKLAGHASATTTAKYYQHIDDGTKRAAVAKLTARDVG